MLRNGEDLEIKTMVQEDKKNSKWATCVMGFSGVLDSDTPQGLMRRLKTPANLKEQRTGH